MENNKIKRRFVRLWMKISPIIPDRIYLSVLFYLNMGYRINWKNPKTFSEKLQWLKIYNRKKEYTKMVDKYAVKEYVAKLIGNDYIIPTLGVWDRPEDIDWNALPNKFVLKTTNGGGSTGVVICKCKSFFDRDKAIEKLKASMKYNIYNRYKEWPYKHVSHRILAEKYIDPSPENDDLPDYKFFCFNGEPKYCQVISGREKKMCIDFFDKDWNHQLFHEPKEFAFADIEPRKPKHLNRMWEAARSLAQGIPFSRIDFYQVRDEVFFGEITFFPTSGMGGFSPQKYDEDLGRMIDLDFNY